MATYVLGDLQGCYTPLRRLLERLRYDPRDDRLWFTGDLVNRGPDSLACLRFVKSLGDGAVVVLGNHDLHLVSVALTGRRKSRDTLDDILAAPDREELLAWLLEQPLLHEDPATGWLLVHAGLPPAWDRAQALALAREANRALAGPEGRHFLTHRMYGNLPDAWGEALCGEDRLRFVVNCFTRLRYCHADGRLDFHHKGEPGSQADGLLPWFAAPGRRTAGDTVLFGHWSTLGRVHWPEHRVYGLDGGCVWGGDLVALHAESGRIVRESCAGYRQPGGD